MIICELNISILFNVVLFGNKYITINSKASLLSIFCYDNSIDFYFYVIYVEGSYCDIIRRNAKQEQFMCTYDGVGYVTSRREA